MWTYGLELWGCASKSCISLIQKSQSKILSMIVDAAWYVSNATLHSDLGISYVHEVIHQECNKHTRLGTHENPFSKHSSNTLSPCSTLTLRDQVSHLYRTTGNIVVLCIVILSLSTATKEAEDSEPNGSKHY
jgi:hypothetical protein